MWTGRATAAGSTVIFFSSIIKTAASPSLNSVRVWGSASWRSASAITGAATIEAGLGMGEKTTGCTGRRRRVIRDLHSGRDRHRGRIRQRGRIRRRDHGRPWIDPRPANRIFRATAVVPRNRSPSPRRARTTSRHRIGRAQTARRHRIVRARTTSRHRIGRRPVSEDLAEFLSRNTPSDVPRRR